MSVASLETLSKRQRPDDARTLRPSTAGGSAGGAGSHAFSVRVNDHDGDCVAADSMALWRVMWWSITLIASGLVIYAGIVAMQELTEEKAASMEAPEVMNLLVDALEREAAILEVSNGSDK